MKVKERRNKMTNRQKRAVYYNVQKRKREGFEKIIKDYSLTDVDFKYKQLQRNIDLVKYELNKKYSWSYVVEILEKYNLI